MGYKELINGFASKYGVADVVVKDGICSLDIDGMTIVFPYDMLPVIARLRLPRRRAKPTLSARFQKNDSCRCNLFRRCV